ncbi:SfnB family sulfur acquisition oxidoreductase [Sphingomonas elodea]|uniref:SfnB family sulfur acquisition oxidoreductase n=1 Tax=Sphingomonas elodea TaxID=179878 RepID=UPI0002630D19|nr:SfnB family sulfur acquisition oxidoreductase [Sphingomonas elodea]
MTEAALVEVESELSILPNSEAAIATAVALARWLRQDSIARDRERPVPYTETERLARSGLLAITVPAAHGGADVPWSTVVEVIRILSTGDGAIGQLPQNHFLFVEAVREDGDGAQQALFFGELLRGARFGNAQAERGSSSAVDLRTRLVAEGDGFRLSGTKYYCTGAIVADWIPVAAIDAEGRQVLAYVKRNAPGVEVRPDWNAFGQKTTFSGTAVFDQVQVPAIQVLSHWRLFERTNAFHPYGVLLHAAVDVGIARAAFDDTVALVKARTRPRLGAQAASSREDVLIQAKLGALSTELAALEALLAHAAEALDRARFSGEDRFVAEAATLAFGTKALAEEVGLAIASALFPLVGTASTDASLGLDRHWRNLRVHSVHDANDWRYVQVGDWVVHGRAPGKPLRALARDVADDGRSVPG